MNGKQQPTSKVQMFLEEQGAPLSEHGCASLKHHKSHQLKTPAPNYPFAPDRTGWFIAKVLRKPRRNTSCGQAAVALVTG